jgi:hypothetical protein
MFDLTDVKYVKRITIGTSNPNRMLSEEEVQQAMNLLNKCLAGPPKGSIVGIEKSFKIFNVGEHQVVMQWLVYHVGFNRKPVWIED